MGAWIEWERSASLRERGRISKPAAENQQPAAAGDPADGRDGCHIFPIQLT